MRRPAPGRSRNRKSATRVRAWKRSRWQAARQAKERAVFSFSSVIETRFAGTRLRLRAAEHEALRLAFDLQNQPAKILRIPGQLLHQVVDLGQRAVGDFSGERGGNFVQLIRERAPVGEDLPAVFRH